MTRSWAPAPSAESSLATSNEGTKVAVKCISKNGELKQEDIDSLHEEVAVLREAWTTRTLSNYMISSTRSGTTTWPSSSWRAASSSERIVKKTFYNEMDARGLVCILLKRRWPTSSSRHRTATSSPRICCSSRRSTTLISSSRISASYACRRPVRPRHRRVPVDPAPRGFPPPQLRRPATTPWRRPHRRGIAHASLLARGFRGRGETPSTRFLAQAKKVEGKSLDTQCGTPGYVAPEILKGKKYGTAVDMWSCGVIVYILLGGYPPFHDDNHAILYRKIKAADYAFDPQYWDQVSDDAKDLIKKMLVVDPDKRLTASQALRHPGSWSATTAHQQKLRRRWTR